MTALRVGVAFCVLVAVGAAAVRVPATLREADAEADKNSALSYADREFAAGNGLVGDQQLLYQARARIARRGTYRVVLGPELRTDSELTRPYAESFARYFLLPRRYDPGARWVLCYGCDRSELGGEPRTVWRNDDGLSLVRVAP